MRRIAIIGSGQNGLLAAHGLLRAGHEVTLYSDRTAEQWLRECKPTGGAGRFDLTLELERSLGLNHWDAETPPFEGVHVTLCPSPRNPLIKLAGWFSKPGLLIDVRLQSHRWTHDLEERGGRVVIEPVTVERLDKIAAEHDLTLVAAGKADLSNLFPRDAARSQYTSPKRQLSMVFITTPFKGFDDIPFAPVKFEVLDGAGEFFAIPALHKDHGPAWAVLTEAVPGGPLDRFGHAKSGEELLALTKDLVREFFPWDMPLFDGSALADPHGWLVGAIAPTVRRPVARLPSGRVVGAIGDTAMLFDPVAGQGANNGNKMVRNLLECLAAHGDGPLDEAFLVSTFERYYEGHGRHLYAFNNSFLEPPTPAARLYLFCQYGSDGRGRDGRQRLADAFVDNFNDPRDLTETLADFGKTRDFITRTAGTPWWAALARGGFDVAAAQVRQRLGRRPSS